jgi:transcriptional regulator with XRE-family HTH domain
MTKAIYSQEYEIYVELLKRQRAESGLTQLQCTQMLGRPQSFMSDVEKGSRRLDLVQLRELLQLLGTDLLSFTQRYEAALANAISASTLP